MLIKEIQIRKEMLKEQYNNILNIEKEVQTLYNEKYRLFSGEEILLGAEVEKHYNDFINVNTMREKNAGDNKQIPEPKRLYAEDFTIEKTYKTSDEGLLEDLKDRVSYLEEAIQIYNDTHQQPDKKLAYILTSEETNKNLLVARFFEDVVGYLQGEIDNLLNSRELKFFRVNVSLSNFSDREVKVSVNFKSDTLPSIVMYTNFNLKQKTIHYPHYVGVESKLSKVYFSEENLSSTIEDMDTSIIPIVERYWLKKEIVEHLKERPLYKYFSKNKVSKLEYECSSMLKLVGSETYRLLKLKEDIGDYIHQLNILEENLTDIHEEQDFIVGKLQELLGIDFQFKEVTFSN